MPEYVADTPDWSLSAGSRAYEAATLGFGSASAQSPWGVETRDSGCGCGCARDCSSLSDSVSSSFGSGCGCGGGSSFAALQGVPESWRDVAFGTRSCACSGPPGSSDFGSAAPKGAHPAAPDDDRREPSAERLEELAQLPECPDLDTVSIGLPPFSKLYRRTRRCFVQAGYSDSRWPEDDCCKVPRRQTSSCELPSGLEVGVAAFQVPNFDNYYAWDARLRGTKKPAGGSLGRSWPHEPTEEDLGLFYSAVAFLWNNWDLAMWATCLVSGWAPETLSRLIPSRLQLLKGLSEGMYKGGMHVTFVDRGRDKDGNLGGATAWAFTYLTDGSAEDGSVGIIIPAEHPDWEKRLREFACGGSDALCTVAQLSGTILHEMIHIVGPEFENIEGVGVATHHLNECPIDEHSTFYDGGMPAGGGVFGRGPGYEPCERWPCWDECRMITSIYRYALMNRYTCLEDAKMCGNMDDPQYVAVSIKHDRAGQTLRNRGFREGSCSGSS